MRQSIVFVGLSLFISAATPPLPGQILPPDARPERLARGFGFTEGPVYDGQGSVYFTDLNRSDIIRYDIASGMTEVADANSGRANGLALDASGRIVAAEGSGSDGNGRITRRARDNVSVVEQVLASQWNGIAFNQPNDLVIDAQGGIYFTDPDYAGNRRQPEGVYYINPQGELSQVLSGFRRPNGVVLSPDGQTLYLAVEAERRIMAYDVGPGGVPTNERLFARTDVDAQGNRLPGITHGPDGVKVDPAGNLYAAVSNAVWAWTPSAERLFELRVPEDPTNVAFGGADGKTLFITAGGSLYGIPLNIVPEPSSLLLTAAGGVVLLGLAFSRRRATGDKVTG
jgi:gluconolactonase